MVLPPNAPIAANKTTIRGSWPGLQESPIGEAIRIKPELLARRLPARHQLQANARYSNSVLPADTTPHIRDIYFQQLAKMTPSERVRVGVSLWETGDSLQRAALRRKNPQANDAEIACEIAVSRFGETLAQAAFRKS